MSLTVVSSTLKSEEGSQSESGNNYTVVYSVVYSGTYSVAAILNYPRTGMAPTAYPWVRAMHLDDPTAYCSELTCKKLATGTATKNGVAEVTATFSPITAAMEASPPGEKSPRITRRNLEIYVTDGMDAAGYAYLNSAGARYPEPPEHLVPGCVEFSIDFETTTNPQDLTDVYAGTMNGLEWNGKAARTCALIGCETEKVVEFDEGGMVTYWKCSAKLWHNPNGWVYRLIDNGFEVRDDDNDQVTATDKNGIPKQVPTLLDGLGKPLAAGNDPVIFGPDDDGDYAIDGFYRQFKSYSWATIPLLPNPWA